MIGLDGTGPAKRHDEDRRVMQVTAEYQPVVTVGGLGEAVRGLVRSLEHRGRPIDVVVPDYAGVPLDQEMRWRLPVPSWAGTVWARRGRLRTGDEITLIGSRAIRRPHPYVNPSTTESWPDNDARFFAFAAGAASLATLERPALVHCHDWHAAPTIDLLCRGPARVLSIHNLAHQGVTDGGWIDRIGPSAEPMRLPGGCDALVGGIRQADAVVTVSPTYREEICTSAGEGIAELVASRGRRLVGILNGIDKDRWNPATDPRITHAYDHIDLTGKRRCRADLLRSVDRIVGGPVVAVVSRLAQQKGIDLSLGVAASIAAEDGLLVIHGDGQRDVAELVDRAAATDARHVVAINGYDETTAHRIIAGADMLLMPSRFEPCGLTQLQALTYGTIPVVTDVGGLHDTVVDADGNRFGTGFVATRADTVAVRDALLRAFSAFRDIPRWNSLQRRAMQADWSWDRSAVAYDDLYDELISDPGRGDVSLPEGSGPRSHDRQTPLGDGQDGRASVTRSGY